VILANFLAEIAESKSKETDALMKHTFGLPFSLMQEAKNGLMDFVGQTNMPHNLHLIPPMPI
jgi:hypothetical protein